MAGNVPYWNDNIHTPSGGASSRYNTPFTNLSDARRSLTSEGGYQDDDTTSQYSAASANDRNCAAEVSRRIRLLFMEQLYTDVKFVINCGMKYKPTLHAHKAILAVGCDQFREMLFNHNSNKGELEIQINNIPYDAFRNVVEYLYTNEVFFENEASAMETLTAALKFQMPSLVDRCESYIKTSELTEKNVCTKYKLAIDYELKSLENRCAEFIQENTAAVLRSPAFTTTNTSIVDLICRMEKLNLSSELELLNGIVRWAEAQPGAKKNKRIVIDPFLKHIRILTLTGHEFNRFVQDHPNIFTAPEVSNILISLANPRHPFNLPSWCNKGIINRCTIYQASPRPRNSIYPENQYFHVPLKPNKGNHFLNNLKCTLRLKCMDGNYVIKAIKLCFDDPVYASSCINRLIITVYRESTKFLEEYICIQNSKSVVVRLSKVVLIKCGQAIYITAEAKDIKDYKFLQHDDSQLFDQDSPFTYSLESEPQYGKFSFISQVIYRKALKRPPQYTYHRE